MPTDNLRRLVESNNWDELRIILTANDAAGFLPQATTLFESLGAALQADGEFVPAPHCYRFDVWTSTLHWPAMPGAPARAERGARLADLRYLFLATHRIVLAIGGQSLSLAGEPVTVEEEWRRLYPQLAGLTQAGDFDAANRLFALIESLPDEHNRFRLAASTQLKSHGDELAADHAGAANWFYRKAREHGQDLLR